MAAPTPRIEPAASTAALSHADSAAAIAALAFGQAGYGAAPNLTHLRHLALLPVETLELDLSDPLQRQFGDYELLELIGEGGMGVVYRARQRSLDREVAIKLLAAGPWASREFVERFRREAQNAARMQHPNIVAIHEVGDAEELHFFSMRLVRGGSLATLLKSEGRLAPRRVAQLLRTVAEAVDYAHGLGVLHLELKPANVLLDEDGTPHVADFGLARRLDSARAVDNDEVSGTPSYMAPEQADARAQKLTAATDIWGLGALLYELTTGAPPFVGESPQATLRLVVDGRLRGPRERVRALPRDLEAIILKCMAIDAAARYASARELADDLGRFLDNRAVHARPQNAPQRCARWVRREPRLAVAVVLVVCALAGGLAATAWQWLRAQHAAERAAAERGFLVGVFEQASPDLNRGQPFTAHQLLEKGEHQLAAGAAGDVSTRIDLTGLIGRLYWQIGDYERARPLLERAVADGAAAGVDDDVRSRNLAALADAEKQQERSVQAIAHAREALQAAERAGGGDLSPARRTLANAYVGGGDAERAVPLLEAALADDRAAHGERSREVVADLTLLGYAELERSQLDASVATTRRAIAAATALGERQSSEVFDALGNLATALGNQGKLAESEQALREAVEIGTRIYGADHHDVASARSNLLLALEREGRFAEALPQRLELIRVAQRHRAERPEQLAYFYADAAFDYDELGRFAEAERTAREAVAIWDDIRGKAEEWHSAETFRTLATALEFQGRYAEAEATFRRTIEIQARHEPASSIWLNRTHGELGDLLRREHRLPEARREIDAALAALPASAGLGRARLLALRSAAEIDDGDAAAADASATKALATLRTILPPGHFLLRGALFAAGRAKLARGAPAAAEALLREARATCLADWPADDPRALEVDVALANALAAVGRRDDARALRARVKPTLRAARTPQATDLLAQLRSP